MLTANHPEYDKVMDQLHQQNISIRDIQHAAKLVALKYVLLCYYIPAQVIYGNCNSQIVFACSVPDKRGVSGQKPDKVTFMTQQTDRKLIMIWWK